GPAAAAVTTQQEKATAFRALHERAGVFIIPNAWDAGSAKLLASLGFEALASTSLGLANALGRVDGEGAVSRGELLANCEQIAQATPLPVSADLENCYAHEPRAAAALIPLAAQAGVVGGSIEDATGDEARPIYDFALAVERGQAGQRRHEYGRPGDQRRTAGGRRRQAHQRRRRSLPARVRGGARGGAGDEAARRLYLDVRHAAHQGSEAHLHRMSRFALAVT